MDRFLIGYSPPPSKKQKSDKEKQREYEKFNRDRTFQKSWQKEYSWLIFDSNKNEMKCNVCLKYESSGSFVSGCSNMRLESIKKHNKSQGHCDNVCKENAKKHTQLDQSTAGRSLLQLNKSVFERLCKLFRNAHMVGKLGRPYTDYVSLCQLDIAKSTDIGKTYITDKACQHFIAAIADDVRRKQDEVFQNAPFFSLISDGSTDTSSQEAEILYTRTSFRGKISTNFVGLKNVPKADGEHITRALVTMMTGRFGEQWRRKVIAVGTDGASVMLGKTSGVVQRLREELERPLYSVHCSAHRLELAYKDATKDINMVKKCELLLLNVYLFYKYSSLNRANLKASFKSLGQEALVPTRVGGTRWLPHTKKALEHAIKGYDAIVQHLEQMQGPDTFKKESSAKARNFLKLLRDQRVRMWMHLILDTVTCLADVTLTIQTKDSTVSDVWLEIQSAKRILATYVTRDGPSLSKVSGSIDLGSSREKFLTSLIAAIDRRFDGDMSLFRGTNCIINFKQWPQSDEGYGDGDVERLTTLAKSALEVNKSDPDKVMAEWTKLKMKIYDSGSNIKQLTWQKVFDTYDTEFPNVLTLIDYLLALPSCSVDAERGFSSMKFVKNDWRSRLGERNLTDLMLLYMESPSISAFNPEDAVQHWFTCGKRSRRPNYMEDVMSCMDPVLVAEEEEEEADGGELLQEEGVQGPKAVSTDGNDDLEDDLDLNLRDIIALQRKKYEMLCEMI